MEIDTKIESRAVPNLPFYLSQANAEFKGNGWASDILAKARIPAPQWLSNLAGRSDWTNVLTIGKARYDAWGYDSSSSPDYRMGELTPREIPNIGYCSILNMQPDFFFGHGQYWITIPNIGQRITIEVEGLHGPIVCEFSDGFGVYSAAVDVSILNWYKSNVGRQINVRILRA